MKCFNCGNNLIQKKGIQCSICHVKYPLECLSCHTVNPQYLKYCGNCGEQLGINNSGLTNFETLSESRKNVAVIFADISGFTALSEMMDPEEVRDIVNGCFDYITKPVYELEGTIDKYIGDCVMILFGAKYSHVDDVQRAVKCALMMQKLIKDYSKERIFEKGIELDLSIGVNFGLVVTGRVGNVYDSDFTVMGDTVNTAQRLQTAAGLGNILVSDTCYVETHDLVQYSEMNEIMVKNKEHPLKCYKALALLDVDIADDVMLVDREKELDSLMTVYTKDFENRYVLVSGESGIGKTSLIDYFCEKLNYKKIYVNCSKIHKNKSYSTISALLYKVSKIKEEENMSDKKHKLSAYLHYLLKDYKHVDIIKNYNYISLLMDLELSDEFNQILRAMAYTDFIREVDLQVVTFFERLYEIQNQVFIFDNMQWVDDDTLRIIKTLATTCKAKGSFYILSSYFDVDFAVNKIQLKALSLNGIEKMLKTELTCDCVEKHLLEKIMTITYGNPLFVKEYLHAIKRQNKYRIKEGQLNVDDEFEQTMPNNIENMILNNLSELSENELQFIYIASCIGKEFNVNWVTKILNVNFDYDLMIRKFVQLNLVTLMDVFTTAGGLNKNYFFNQETVREVIYNSILNKQKIEINRKIGELIEKEYHHEIESYYGALYKYFSVAEKWEKAVEYVYKGARKSKSAFQLQNALSFYKLFIHLHQSHQGSKDDRRLVNCYIEMASVYLTLSQNDEATQKLFEGLTIAKLSDDKYAIKLMLVEIYKDTGRYDEASTIIEEIEPMLRENSNIYGKLLLFKCNILYYKRDKDLMRLAEESAKILTQTRDYDSLGQLESIVGMFCFVSGKNDDAFYYLNKAYEHSEQAGNLKLLNKTGGNLGIMYHQSGNVSKALDYFNKTLEISESLSDIKTNITVCINLGVLYNEKGGFDQSTILLEKARTKSKEFNLIYQQCTASMNLGDVFYEKGILSEAIDLYQESLALSIEHQLNAEEGICYASMAKVMIKQNKLEEAKQCLDKSYGILNEINEISGLIDVYIGKSLIEMMKQNYEQALVYCKHVIEYSEETEDDYKMAIGLRLNGKIQLELSNHQEAIFCYDASIKLCHQLESSYQSAIGHFERSKLYERLNENLLSIKDLELVHILLNEINTCAWKSKMQKILKIQKKDLQFS